MSFNQKYYNNIIKSIKSNRVKLNMNKKYFKYNEFKKLIPDNKTKWKLQMSDLLYALESKKKVQLIIKNGNIVKIKLLF